jgi:RsiW-degrading membrane proteinase PrsW (M82 family)
MNLPLDTIAWGFIAPLIVAALIGRKVDPAATEIKRLLLWFAWGAAVAFLTLVVETHAWRLAAPFVVPAARDFVEAFLLAGLTEELCKIALIYSVSQQHKLWTRSSIIAAAIIIGGGFAGAENVVYVLTSDVQGIVIVRMLTAVPMHIANAVISAHFIHRAVEGGERRDEQLAIALVVATLLHGLYDYLVLTDSRQSGQFAFALVLVVTIAVRLARAR